MAIKVKAIERNVSFTKGEEKWAYVLQADLYSKLTADKVIQEAALRSGISRGSINAAWDAIGEVIKAWATEGHSVAVPGLGSMRFGLRSDSVADVNKVAASLITSRRVIFTPNTEIRKALAETAVNITCYDRNGNIVKRVTSTDEGNVEEEPEDPNDNGGGSGNSGGSDNTGGGSDNTGGGSGNSGSSDNTGGGSDNTGGGDDLPPVIGGEDDGGSSGGGSDEGGDEVIDDGDLSQ